LKSFETKILLEYVKSVTTVESLKFDEFKEMLIPLPPFSEQSRIVERLEEVEVLIEDYSKNEEYKRRLENNLPLLLKKSILQYAIQGKLIPQSLDDEPASILLMRIQEEKKRLLKEKRIKADKHESVIFKGVDNKYYEKVNGKVLNISYEVNFSLPVGWEFVRLQMLCWLGDGERIVDERLPYFEAKYLRGKSASQVFDSGKKIIPPCKVILVDGENSGEIFNVFEEGYLGSTFKVLGISGEIYDEYLHILLDNYKDIFKNSKIGAAIPHLNKDLFKNLVVGLPPIDEQKRIVEATKLALNKLYDIKSV
jgi:type I restriction enzyme S subunit